MVKCSECGFLSVWLVREQQFVEATEYFRTNGHPENMLLNPRAYQAKCFVQEIPINTEIKVDRDHPTLYKDAVSGVINKDRICNRKTDWFQGRSPKEHQEMLDRKSERRWRIAEGLIFAITGAVVGSLVALAPQWSAKPVIPVVNISPPSITITSPPINVTVQPTAEQSTPPKTKHDPKPPQP